MQLLLQFSITIAGFAVMIIAADLMVRGAAAIARSYGVSPMVIGLTVVAYGTSMPEFMASFTAIRNNIPGIAVGNVLGSNVCNIALVLGTAALIVPVKMNKDVLKIQLPLTMIITIICMLMFFQGNTLNRLEGMILFSGLVVYTLWLYKRSNNTEEKCADQPIIHESNRLLASVLIMLGCIGLFFGGEWVIKGASGLAESFRVPARIIGTTVIAFGTSLPELITTIIGVVKKETDLGVGNAIGSCIFNLLLVLGVTAIFRPVHATVYEYRIEFAFCLISIVLLYPLSGLKNRLFRFQGAILLIFYITFLIMIF